MAPVTVGACLLMPLTAGQRGGAAPHPTCPGLPDLTPPPLPSPPPQVKLLTGHLPCGGEVQIDIDATTPLLLVKQKVFEASGLPVEHQKLMLSGINQLVVGDRR
jgi:hypothetical protein